MGKLVVTEFVSLDGVMQAPGGEEFKYPGWSFEFDRGDDGNQFKLDETMETDVLLIGRVTYESFAGAWPSREGDFADKFNSMPKYVVSSTLEDPEWNNTTVIKGDAAEEAAKLKEDIDGIIQVPGSLRLAQALLESDLVDELHLMVFPVVLGTGRRLFGEMSEKTDWRLVESKPVGPDGVLVLVYERRRGGGEIPASGGPPTRPGPGRGGEGATRSRERSELNKTEPPRSHADRLRGGRRRGGGGGRRRCGGVRAQDENASMKGGQKGALKGGAPVSSRKWKAPRLAGLSLAGL